MSGTSVITRFVSTCKDCGIQFESYNFLMDHKKSLKTILKCRKCPKLFPNACERYVHSRNKDCNIDLLLGCNYCNRKFANIEKLQKHKSGECEQIKKSGNDGQNILVNLMDAQEKIKEQKQIAAVQNFFNYNKNPNTSNKELEVLANKIGAGKSAVLLWFNNLKKNSAPKVNLFSQDRTYHEPVTAKKTAVETFYNRNPNATNNELVALANQIGAGPTAVFEWFNKLKDNSKRYVDPIPQVISPLDTKGIINNLFQKDDGGEGCDKPFTTSSFKRKIEDCIGNSGENSGENGSLLAKKNQNSIMKEENFFNEQNINTPVPRLNIISNGRNYYEPTMEEENIDDPEEEIVDDSEEKNGANTEENNIDDPERVPTTQENNDQHNVLDSTENLQQNFQNSILEKFFSKKPYPNNTDLNNLAIVTTLGVKAIKDWFMKKRETKEFMELQQESLNVIHGKNEDSLVSSRESAQFNIKINTDKMNFNALMVRSLPSSTKNSKVIENKFFQEETNDKYRNVKVSEEKSSLERTLEEISKEISLEHQNILDEEYEESKLVGENKFNKDKATRTSIQPYHTKSVGENKFNHSKGRRNRQPRTSIFHKAALETSFTKWSGNYPDENDYKLLMKSTEMTKTQIRVWFMNKKAAVKKTSQDQIKINERDEIIVL